MRLRYPLLAVVAVLAALIGYLIVSLQFGERPDGGVSSSHPLPPPFVIFRALAPREAYGRVAVQGLAPDAKPRMSRLACTRLHYAGGRGLCAMTEQSSSTVVHVAYLFDQALARGPRIALDGVPTRLRVAPNGRVGAVTTYAEVERPEGERLTTRTTIVDMQTGREIADLGEFSIDSAAFPPIHGDKDFFSVAFERDGDRFFATIGTDAARYLVAGSLQERRLSVLRSGVANEALSPDGRRLAVKRLVPERGFWQLAVIDLRTWAEQDLRQGPRSIDDQVEWLDNDHVVYHDVDGDSTALWMLPIDGVNGPSVLVKDAYSGSVQR